jgi:hypothetical protein
VLHTNNVLKVPRKHNGLLAQADRGDFGDETVADWTDREIVQEGEQAKMRHQRVSRSNDSQNIQKHGPSSPRGAGVVLGNGEETDLCVLLANCTRFLIQHIHQ